MAEKIQSKSNHSKLRDDNDAKAGSKGKDSRTTRTGRGRTHELAERYERNLSHASGGGEEARRQRTNPVQIIPSSTLITVSSPDSGIAQPLASSSSSSSSDRDKRHAAQSKISVRSGSDRARQHASKAGETGEGTFGTRVTSPPPLSPPPDDTTVRNKPRYGGANYNILPSQTNPSGAIGTSATKGSTPLTTAGTTDMSVTKGLTTKSGATGLSSSSKSGQLRVSMPHPSSPHNIGYQSLPSPTTSSGTFSSGELPSSGGLLSGEHTGTATQCKSLNTGSLIHMVDGHSQRSFDIHRSDLTVVNNQTHQQIVDDHLRAMATPRETSQGNDGEDDTLQASICHSKMLLQNQSLDVNEEGRTILRTTSEGSGVTVRKDIEICQLQDEKRQLQEKLEERDGEVENLRKLLSMQTSKAVPGDERKTQGNAAQEEELGYTQQTYMNYLTSEVKSLMPLAGENERLKRQMNHLEEVNKQAKIYETKAVEQVITISEKDAEIERLKRAMERSSDPALREQLSKKDMEISRLKARLAKQDKEATGGVGAFGPVGSHESSSTDGPHRSSGDIADLPAEELKRKDALIDKLKKRVNDLTEKTLVLEGMLPEDSQQKLADVGVADEGGEVTRHLDETEYVAQMQEKIKEKDEKIKTVTNQLQDFEKMAGNVVQIHKHSREQSEVIAQLKKQLEVAGDGDGAGGVVQVLREEVESLKEKMERKEAKLNQKRQEIEHLKRNASVADGTIRKLRIQNTQLEAEKTKLVNDSHKYANTKLEQTEKERAALLKQVEEQEQIMSSMDARANQLNQQNRALEEQVRVLGKVREEKEHLEQKLISQTATIQNIEQRLHATKQRATELGSTLEQQKIEAYQLQKAKQDLEGEVEAHKMTAQVYREDFETERKDREKAHAQHVEVEERYRKEIKELKHQIQLVSADCGRLTQQMQSERAVLAEKNKHIEDLRADKNVLQGEIQSKTQQVKQYKKQVDQFRGELDRCRADMEAYKQQAEHHKQQIEVVVNQCEHSIHTAKVLEGENKRLQKDVYTLQAREHIKQHAHSQQGGRGNSLISPEEFMKERQKAEDMERLANDLRHKLDNVTLEKVLVESRLEDLQQRVQSSSSSRSPPPGSSTGTTRPPPYPGHRGQGGSALPNPMRPQHQHQSQNRRMNQQMKSASVDSADVLSSRGHVESAQYQAPFPSISVADSNPPPPTTRPGAVYRTDQRYQQPPHAHHKSHTSALPSPQRDLAISQPFQAVLSNSTGGTNAQAAAAHGGGGGTGGRGGYPYSSAIGHGGNVVTNAGMGGGNSQYPAMNSPPTNAKFNAPFPTSSAGGPTLMPGPPSSSSGGSNYPQTSPHHVSASVSNMQQPPPLQPHGSQLAPGLSQAGGTFPSNVPLASNVAQSSAGSRVAPPFSSHGPSVPARTAVGSQDAAQRQFYHNLPFDHQVHDQYHMSPPPDDGQGSGHMSLPSFGSGGFQQQQQVGQPQAPVHGHPQANHNHHHTPKDDLYLIQQQKGGHGYHHHHHHPGEGSSGQSRAYPSAIDVVEKDSSPPSSFVPQQGPSQQGPPLSLNPQSLSQQPAPQHRQRYSHQVPLSPEHSKNDNNMGIPGGAKQQPRRVMPDGLRPTVGGGHGMMMQGGRNDPVQLPPHHVQSAQVLAYQHQQQQQRRTAGGAMVNQGQRPASHAVKGSIQESGTGSMKLPPSMQKPSGSGAVYVTSQERRNQEQHRPEPDSDSVSNVSMESGLSSPTGDGRANANENTLEKGIDGDIRRAARNIKKQMGGKESSVGGGVEAPYDPNLTCPSCGFRFRIGEIQKFKRHASTCTGT